MSDYKPVIQNGAVVDYSDGYHTFTELYAHRVALWVQLAKRLNEDDYYTAWRSKLHDDGTGFDGWFVLGVTCIETEQQISYHLPISEWERCEWVDTLERAPKFDGHTSADVLERINRL